MAQGDDSDASSVCYSHDDYELFDEYDYVGRGWCRDTESRAYSYISIFEDSLEGCAEACQSRGNSGAQVGFTFTGSICYCQYTDGKGPDGNIETSLNSKNTGVGPVDKGDNALSYDLCYSHKEYGISSVSVSAEIPTRGFTLSASVSIQLLTNSLIAYATYFVALSSHRRRRPRLLQLRLLQQQTPHWRRRLRYVI